MFFEKISSGWLSAASMKALRIKTSSMKRLLFLLPLLCLAFSSCGPFPTCRVEPLYFPMMVDSVSQISRVPQEGGPVHIIYHYGPETRFEPAIIYQNCRIRAMADGEIFSSFQNTTWRDTIVVAVPMNDTYSERQIRVEISLYDHTDEIWGEWSEIFSAVQDALPAHQPQRLNGIEKRDIIVNFNGQNIAIETVNTPSALAFKALLSLGDMSVPVWVANNSISTMRSEWLYNHIPLNPEEINAHEVGEVFYSDGMLWLLNEDVKKASGSIVRIGRIRKNDLQTFNRFCYEGHDDQIMTFSLSEYRHDKTE